MTDKLDALLTQSLRDDRDSVSTQRVLAALHAAPLPRQKQGFLRWPPFLLHWDFTPAWPRVGALASCAALGFMLGLAGLDATPDGASASAFRARTDVASIVGDADPLTDIFR